MSSKSDSTSTTSNTSTISKNSDKSLSNTKILAPTSNNKTKKTVDSSNKVIDKPTTTSSAEFATAKEDAGVYEIVSDNYLLLLGVSAGLIIFLIIYFLSETYRVGRSVDKMLVYQGFQKITSMDITKYGETRLGDYYISSAYNASHCGFQMYDYTNENIVLATLQSGVRYLEFNVFNSEFGDNAYPVVSMGYKTGEWKMMISDTPLESIFSMIADNAFSVYDGKNGVNNPEDPIFIGLNLNTNSNLNCLNLTGFLITQYFGSKINRLLDNAYSYQNIDAIGDIKMSQLSGKVVIFASDGFQGSGLEEIVNYSWDNIDNNPNHLMQRIHYSEIEEPNFNTNKLIEYNRTGLTIVVPHKEGDFFNGNFNPIKAFELGCQFVAMEFQNIDSNMDAYITKFKNKSFVMKNNNLQKGKTNIKKPFKNIANTNTNTTPNPTIIKATRPNRAF